MPMALFMWESLRMGKNMVKEHKLMPMEVVALNTMESTRMV